MRHSKDPSLIAVYVILDKRAEIHDFQHPCKFWKPGFFSLKNEWLKP